MSSSPPIKPFRIAILVADHGFPRYNGYLGLWTNILHAGADALGWPRDRLQISAWDVVTARGDSIGEYPRLEDVDAILITGSKASAFENFPWVLRLVEFAQEVLTQKRVKLIGSCFGHQIMGRALGSKVMRAERGFEMSVIDISLTARGKKLFDGKDALSIMSMHRDVIASLPPDTQLLGSTPHTSIQGMYVPARLISVLGHPEFTKDLMSELLHTRRHQNLFDEDEFQDAMSRVGNRLDGVVVAKAFLRFLLE